MQDPVYFPIDKGLYEVALSLRPLGTDFGNGDFDKSILHTYSNYSEYYQNKLSCLKERKSKYVCRSNISPNQENVLTNFLIARLKLDMSSHLYQENDTLKSSLIDFNVDLKMEDKSLLLDQICMFSQEDIALVTRNDQTDYIAYLNLCSPSHWAAEDKIGKNFFDVHFPIPGIEKINANANKIVEMMIHKGPFVRFIWSFVTDTRLNHHPIAPQGMDHSEWKGRSFNKSADIPFYLRIERQCIFGLPEVNASVFTIGVNFISGKTVKDNPVYKDQLKSALLSMSLESREYKGVAHCFSDLLDYLA